ncbi:MAG: hypothetical protein GW903_09760 [Alphaproteobacteria bacterium]|nr:hypothetical protein [Alphaproteobacteria bacterium]NCQ89291.1 hypothetical protein [Alphaproteobacteria bacterium]NCT08155.1 hypothetical protein [Alphaproteobacteria bacterium]
MDQANRPIDDIPFSPEALIKDLGLRSASPRVIEAVKILWFVYLKDNEGWDKSKLADRHDVKDILISHIRPITYLIDTFAPTFPLPLNDIDDLYIAAVCDAHIMQPEFMPEDETLTTIYYETAFCYHEGDESNQHDAVPQRNPVAFDIFNQMHDVETKVRKTPDGMRPEAHYLYLIMHFGDLEDCIQDIQDSEIDYETKRSFADKFTRVNPAFLLKNDPLSQAIIEAEILLERLRPKKATLFLVPTTP